MNAVSSEGEGPLTGREAALVAVHDVLRRGGFAGETLARLRTGGRLAGRELALATEIALGTVRHLRTIEHVLSEVARYEPRHSSPDVRATLSTGAYQVVWMDRVPQHAAVDESVALARRQVGVRAAGLVNAILRSLTRAIRQRRTAWRRLDARQVRVNWEQACEFDRAVLPGEREGRGMASHLALSTGERAGRYRALAARFGPEAAEALAWASQATPVTVAHRNPLRCGPAEFVAAAVSVHAEVSADVAFLPPSLHLLDWPLFAGGGAYVQDPTAHAAVLLLEARPGDRVLDLCAAPGGKSVGLAIDMRDQGEIVACDASPQRLARVLENTARLGLTCIHVRPPPKGGTEPGECGELYDAALADVPCSNTGVIARRPEARFRLTRARLASLLRLQRALLRCAAVHVRPGGRLVYSTCSLEPEENEAQVEDFLREHANWTLARQQLTLPQWGPHLSDWHDGGYAARLVRRE